MSVVRCEHCGAPLELAEGARSVRCSYCQHHQVVSGLVTAVEGPLARVGVAGERFARGQAVLCEWRGRWWPASILEVLPADRYLIHYDGYSSSWDEVVGLDRLAPRSLHASPTFAFARSHVSGGGGGRGAILLAAIVVVAVAGVGATVALVGQSASAPAAVVPSATSVGVAPGQLVVGQPVLVLWGERWWNATVLRVHPDGRARIHYDGWAESWDEDVTLDRVRLR